MAGKRARTLAIAPTKAEILTGVAVMTVLASVLMVRGGEPSASVAQGVDSLGPQESVIVPAKREQVTQLGELHFTMTPAQAGEQPEAGTADAGEADRENGRSESTRDHN